VMTVSRSQRNGFIRKLRAKSGSKYPCPLPKERREARS
jgi:hypothetical protein